MSTKMLVADIWPTLTKEVRACRSSSHVAVAYFGAGASELLPLSVGSRLVVDASEKAVVTGQTCPKDLLALMERGVAVFSVPNLHAKVYVLGRRAFIGSANTSNHSASRLIEAMLETSTPTAVNAARRFVRDHCLDELTPEVAKRLQKLYRPPHMPGGGRRKPAQVNRRVQPELPRLLLAQLKRAEWGDEEQAIHDAGEEAAKMRRKHPRTYALDSFRFAGKHPFQIGDKVIQITKEEGGSVLVSAPGNVIHVRSATRGTRRVSFIYLEIPERRRRAVKTFAKLLGPSSTRVLKRNGQIRNATVARALLAAWVE